MSIPGQNRRASRAAGKTLSRRAIWMMVAGITLGVICLTLVRPTFTEFIEFKLYDLKLRYRGNRPAGPDLAVVAIDDASLQRLGRWPWSREVIAAFISRLKAAQPKVIALDIIFAEKADTQVSDALGRLRQRFGQFGLASPTIQGLLAEEVKAADLDGRLAEAIRQGSPTVLGLYFKQVGVQVMSPGPPESLVPAVIQVSTYNLVRRLGRQSERLPIIGAQGVEVNLPRISEAAAGGGYFNMIPDPDGAVRWYPLAIAYGHHVFAPLALVTLHHYLDQRPLGITLSPLGVREVRLGRELIPVDRYGRLFINYLGPAGSFPTYAAADVLEGRLPPGALRDKIVLVGATAPGIYDLRVTPLSGVFPGIEIQATIVDNVLRGQFIKPVPYSPLPEALLILGLGVFLGLVLPRLSALWIFAWAILLLEGYLAANYLLFRYFGVNLDLFYPMAQVVLLSTGISVQSFLAEEKARASLKKAFQSYVAPSVVEEMLKHPEQLRLGGERRHLTIFFCDLRGFTTLSESLEPEELAKVLHDFLNPMSHIIVNHGGTIDKFMGDAIMALFGAPLPLPDHPVCACDTALEMIKTLYLLDREWASQGRPSLRLGVGINTGTVAVGNMGSDTLFDYTAIGDNVNLASRLEGLNKYYGTEIIISAATAQAVADRFVLRELDLVQVKGKTHPVAIFELLGRGAPTPEVAGFLNPYHQGLQLFRERRWHESAALFTQALAMNPLDPHSQRYLDLSRQFLAAPPGPDWQGLSIMEKK